MFSSLSKGSPLHGVDWRGDMRWFTGTVERVTPSMSKQYNNVFGQFPALVFDIVVNVDGEQKQFQQIPGNDVVADFGKGAFIIADSKDSLYNYMRSQLKKSEDIVASEEEHKARIPQIKHVLSDMMPGSADSDEVKELRGQVQSMQEQLAEALALLRQGKNKSKE